MKASTLRTLIRRADMTQSEVAGRLGIYATRITDWSNGRTRLPVEYVMPLAKLLNVPEREIIAVCEKARNGK